MTSDTSELPRKRLFGAIRDLLSSHEDLAAEPPLQRARTSTANVTAVAVSAVTAAAAAAAVGRIPIEDLLVAPPICAACLERVPRQSSDSEGISNAYTCHACFGAFCNDCLTSYARVALEDISLLPLRCASINCRTPVPLRCVSALLSLEEASALAVAQQRRLFSNQAVTNEQHVNSSPLAVQEDETNCSSSTDGLSADLDGHHGSSSIEDVARSPVSADRNNNSSPTAIVNTNDFSDLERLMQQEGWQRCPQCGTGVERTFGCRHIVCVCGGEFCYGCGERWIPGGVGCPRRCGLGIGLGLGFGFGGDGGLHIDRYPIPDLGMAAAVHPFLEEQANLHRRGNIPAFIFEHMRDEVWRRILELLNELRFQQAANMHPHHEVSQFPSHRAAPEQPSVVRSVQSTSWNDGDRVQDIGEERSVDRSSLNQHVSLPVLATPAPSRGQFEEHAVQATPIGSQLVHVSRVAVGDLIHSDNMADFRHGIAHLNADTSHRSMPLSSLVLHNLDFLLDDRARDSAE